MIGFDVQLASTPELREAVHRLRHEVLVEEMHMCRGTADHGRRLLAEECDATSRLLLATVDGEPAGTLRLTLGKDGPLPDEYEGTYDISSLVPSHRADEPDHGVHPLRGAARPA